MTGLQIWAKVVNPFFSNVMQIQAERDENFKLVLQHILQLIQAASVPPKRRIGFLH
jgi:hypothetical protein